jgi:hypothetical protein
MLTLLPILRAVGVECLLDWVSGDDGGEHRPCDHPGMAMEEETNGCPNVGRARRPHELDRCETVPPD